MSSISIRAQGLRKTYGGKPALDGVNLQVESGRIVGLIGSNGAGKTTLLKAILGLTPCQGELQVLGRDPRAQRDLLMHDVSFVADVAVLPGWLRVAQAVDFVEGVHPRFDRPRAQEFLARTGIEGKRRVRELSKGMVAQLHLALIMAIDARLLVLDEPTLGLDLSFRKQFFDSLLGDYLDRSRTVLIATHQVDEIEHVLTDVLFLKQGRIALDCSMEDFQSRYCELTVNRERVATARALGPLREREVLGRSVLLFDGADRRTLATLGEVRTPNIADLFTAVVGQAIDKGVAA